MSKGARIIIIVISSILGFLAVMAYPIYAIVVWNVSKSPDDISKFPVSGVWVCREENFVITIDLQNVDEGINIFKDMKVTIEFDGVKQCLDCYKSHGHGTPLSPTAPSVGLNFCSAELSSDNSNYIQFSSWRYKFNDGDFYLLGVYVTRNNNANIFEQDMDLHFIRQN